MYNSFISKNSIWFLNFILFSLDSNNPILNPYNHAIKSTLYKFS